MSKILLIGDSNVYRNVTPDRLASKVGQVVSLIQATRQVSLDIGLKEATKHYYETVIISAVANLICDASVGVSPEELASTIDQTISSYVSGIAVKTSKVPNVLLLCPLLRSSPPWFAGYRDRYRQNMTELIKPYSNMTLLPDFPVNMDVDLVTDGVHLTPEAGARFFDFLVECLLDVRCVTTTSGEPATNEAQKLAAMIRGESSSSSGDVLDFLRSTIVPKLDDISGMKTKIGAVEQTTAKRMLEDDAILARHSDELDQLKNQKWENRVVIVGMKSDNYPEQLRERKNYLADRVRPLIESIIGETVFDVYPKPALLSNGIVPPFEIRFPTIQDCQKFKKEAFKKVKEDPATYGELGIHPRLTLASRVRVEILRAISKKLTAPNASGYCPIYGTRPILHVGPAENGRVQPTETLTFVDAVLRYRHLLTINDLHFAYQRVGNGFKDALRQTFMVLNEDDRTNHSRARQDVFSTPPEQTPRGQKRPGPFGRGRGNFRGKRAR